MQCVWIEIGDRVPAAELGGVVDQRGRAAELGGGALEQACHILRPADIGPDRDGATAGPDDVADHRLGTRFVVQVIDRDGELLPAREPRRRGSDRARAAGDDANLALFAHSGVPR